MKRHAPQARGGVPPTGPLQPWPIHWRRLLGWPGRPTAPLGALARGWTRWLPLGGRYQAPADVPTSTSHASGRQEGYWTYHGSRHRLAEAVSPGCQTASSTGKFQ